MGTLHQNELAAEGGMVNMPALIRVLPEAALNEDWLGRHATASVDLLEKPAARTFVKERQSRSFTLESTTGILRCVLPP